MIKLKNVEKEFRKLNIRTKDDLLKKADVVTDLLLSDLRESTPVDTGNAKASWNKIKTNDKYKISNSAEYIQYLNAGSSQQAPAFFIEATALRYGKPVGTIVDVKQD